MHKISWLVLMLTIPLCLLAKPFIYNSGNYTISIEAPDAFTVRKVQEKEKVTTFEVSLKDKHEILILIDFVELPDSIIDISNLKESVTAKGNEFLPNAVEKRLQLHEIKNTQVIGYYFEKLTDKAAKPEEYAYIIQGEIALNRSAAAFTIIYNTKGAGYITQILSMIKKITVVQKNGSAKKR